MLRNLFWGLGTSDNSNFHSYDFIKAVNLSRIHMSSEPLNSVLALSLYLVKLTILNVFCYSALRVLWVL